MDCETTSKKKTVIMRVYMVEEYKKVENANTQNDYKTTSKKWADKKKQTCYLCFVNKFKFQKKTSSRLFRRILGNKDNINQKRFLGKATSHSDHCMINVSSQRLKIGGSWLLIGPYLQRWYSAFVFMIFYLYSLFSQCIRKNIVKASL